LARPAFQRMRRGVSAFKTDGETPPMWEGQAKYLAGRLKTPTRRPETPASRGDVVLTLNRKGNLYGSVPTLGAGGAPLEVGVRPPAAIYAAPNWL